MKRGLARLAEGGPAPDSSLDYTLQFLRNYHPYTGSPYSQYGSTAGGPGTWGHLWFEDELNRIYPPAPETPPPATPEQIAALPPIAPVPPMQGGGDSGGAIPAWDSTFPGVPPSPVALSTAPSITPPARPDYTGWQGTTLPGLLGLAPQPGLPALPGQPETPSTPTAPPSGFSFPSSPMPPSPPEYTETPESRAAREKMEKSFGGDLFGKMPPGMIPGTEQQGIPGMIPGEPLFGRGFFQGYTPGREAPVAPARSPQEIAEQVAFDERSFLNSQLEQQLGLPPGTLQTPPEPEQPHPNLLGIDALGPNVTVSDFEKNAFAPAPNPADMSQRSRLSGMTSGENTSRPTNPLSPAINRALESIFGPMSYSPPTGIEAFEPEDLSPLSAEDVESMPATVDDLNDFLAQTEMESTGFGSDVAKALGFGPVSAWPGSTQEQQDRIGIALGLTGRPGAILRGVDAIANMRNLGSEPPGNLTRQMADDVAQSYGFKNAEEALSGSTTIGGVTYGTSGPASRGYHGAKPSFDAVRAYQAMEEQANMVNALAAAVYSESRPGMVQPGTYQEPTDPTAYGGQLGAALAALSGMGQPGMGVGLSPRGPDDFGLGSLGNAVADQQAATQAAQEAMSPQADTGWGGGTEAPGGLGNMGGGFGGQMDGDDGWKRGGLVKEAKRVKGAGRKGDSMLAHINPSEASMLARLSGGPHKNPKTGLPEFFGFDDIGDFFGGAVDFVVPAAAAIAGGAFFGPLGAAAGGALGSLLMGKSAEDAVMTGALSGIGSWGAGKLGGDATQGMFGGGDGADSIGGAVNEAGSGDWWGQLTSAFTSPAAMVGLGGAAAIGGASALADRPETSPDYQAPQMPMPPEDPWTNYTLSQRQYQPYGGDYSTYAQTASANPGEHEFFDRVNPEKILAADGGQINGPGGGQDDLIPAMLSSGEFVVPADIVGNLGDGDTDAGADILDAWMQSIRSHKTMKRGAFPPMAKTPQSYLEAVSR